MFQSSFKAVNPPPEPKVEKGGGDPAASFVRSSYRPYTLFLSSYDRGYLEALAKKHQISLCRAFELCLDLAVAENLLCEDFPENS